MDEPSVSRAVAAPLLAEPPPKSASGSAGVPTRVPEVVAAWPRSAQLAVAFVLGGVVVLLGVHVASYMRGGEPALLLDLHPVTYRVDLNEARRAELLQLPGVGPNLADRIEDYRRMQGGFRSVDELRKVSGIGPATMEKLRPLVCVRSGQTSTTPVAMTDAAAAGKTKVANLKAPVDVNTASLTELQTLPGIGPKMSKRIVDERERKAFASVEDLRRVPGIGVKTLEKLRPYVTVTGSSQ